MYFIVLLFNFRLAVATAFVELVLASLPAPKGFLCSLFFCGFWVLGHQFVTSKHKISNNKKCLSDEFCIFDIP